MKTKITAAAVHAAPVYMDKEATLSKVADFIKKAQGKVDFLVFPETFVPGYPYFIETHPPLQYAGALALYAKQSVVIGPDGGDLKPLMALCAASGVSVCLGVSERVADGHTLFNSQVFIDANGDLLGVHRKLQPTYVERAVWAQGSGATLKVWESSFGRVGGLACWEHCMNGARQALIQGGQEIHAGAWPALSTMAGFEAGADAQIEALMKSHALMAQVFVVCAGNYVDEACLAWIEEHLGPQELVKKGGGISFVADPFCGFLAGPVKGGDEGDRLLVAELDPEVISAVKVWVDGAGHYKRPEVLGFQVNRQPIWNDDDIMARGVRFAQEEEKEAEGRQ
ncbi:carbon-nitrogen hydrolase [Xylariales sp. AK1849]|nr:carbon-nitrogen hydrolase [Xylariales sp. AK1849]